MSDGRQDNDKNLTQEDWQRGGENSHQNKQNNSDDSHHEHNENASNSGHELTDEERARGGRNS